jgi:UDP-3-O-[3-hydroxymyristoyl] glucosamine N-acyltransferase
MGAPAIDLSQFSKAYVIFRKLPELYAKVGELEKKLGGK